MCCLFNGKRLNRTIIRHMPMLIMTPKAFSEGGCGSTADRDVDNSSGGGKSLCSILERDEKGSIESEYFLVDSSMTESKRGQELPNAQPLPKMDKDD